MRSTIYVLATVAALLSVTASAIAQDSTDWPNLRRYAAANDALGVPAAGERRVVFMGNSITDAWADDALGIIANNPAYVGRGISGQTTPQMLARFRQDVLELQPAVVVILAGINDIAGNTGPMTLDQILGNLASMAELALANGVRVVLSSVLPAFDFPWRPGMRPAQKVVELNERIEAYAVEHDLVYLDYFSAMADDRPGLPPELASDGIHPTPAGYRMMEPLAEAAIAEALAKSSTDQATAMTNESPRRAGMMHTVYFWLKPGLSDEEIASFEEGVRSLAKAPSVVKLLAGPPAATPSRGVVDNTFDFALSLWFEDVTGHDAYQVDPVHLKFVEEQEAKFGVVKVFDNALTD